MSKIFEAFVKLDLRDNFSKGMIAVGRTTKRTAKGINRVWSASMQKMRRDFDKSKKHIAAGQKGMRDGFLMMTKGVAMAAPFALAAKSFQEYEKGLAEVATLTDKSTGEIVSSYGKIVDSTSTAFGQKSQEIIKALYDGFSAGVPQTERAANKYLDAVGKMAVGGKTDMVSAADAITTAMNAWKIEDFGRISDVMFGAVKAGKTTMVELSQSLGQVASMAGQSGVSIEETMAAVAALTAAGVKTPQAMTQIQSAISGIIKPAKEAQDIYKKLKLTITPLTLKQKGLAGTIDMMQAAINKHTKSEAERKKMLALLFPRIEAYKAITTLAGGQNENFTATLKEMTSETGQASEAFKKMTDTDAFKYEQAMRRLEVAWKDFGAAASPIITQIISEFTPMVKEWGAWAKQNPETLGTVTKIGLGVAGITASAGAIKIVSGAFKVLWGIITGVGAAVGSVAGAIVVALASVVGAVWFLSKNWNETMETLKMAWRTFAFVLEDVWISVEMAIMSGVDRLIFKFKSFLGLTKSGVYTPTAHTSAAIQALAKKREVARAQLGKENVASIFKIGREQLKKQDIDASTRINSININMNSVFDPDNPLEAETELKRRFKKLLGSVFEDNARKMITQQAYLRDR